ncbi:MAG: YeeE/YedE family protein [Candidatus Velthaea sp.]
MKYWVALLCGTVFGFGLSVSQMSEPMKVLGFLDIAGNWDPSLLLVLGGAVGVTAVSFRSITKRKRPICDAVFERPSNARIDGALVGGAAIFGVGWGLSGYCPGPGIVSLARFSPDAVVFVACFLAGSWLYRALRQNHAAAS